MKTILSFFGFGLVLSMSQAYGFNEAQVRTECYDEYQASVWDQVDALINPIEEYPDYEGLSAAQAVHLGKVSGQMSASEAAIEEAVVGACVRAKKAIKTAERVGVEFRFKQ